MDWSLAHVRRQRKSVFYRLFIYGCARKAYQSQSKASEASGGKTLARKRVCGARPIRAKQSRKGCPQGVPDTGSTPLLGRRDSETGGAAQVVVAWGCPR